MKIDSPDFGQIRGANGGTALAYAGTMTFKLSAALFVLAIITGCASARQQAGSLGSAHTHRFQQPPREAARCFARNAEEHSSALVSEVSVAREGGAEVIVRVKNGVTYASADFRRSGAGSAGTITLMVKTSGRRSDLIDALVEGC